MKKINKDREPIALRTKPLKDGRLSLYLDYYEPEHGRNHAHRYEFLKLYLLPERRDTREKNRATLEAANAIKAQRLIDRANGKAQITKIKTNLTLNDYFDIVIKKKKATGMSEARLKIYYALQKKIKAKYDTPLSNIDVEYMRRFLLDLAASNDERAKHEKSLIKPTTILVYFNILNCVINSAVTEKLIAKNPAHELTADDKRILRTKQAPREYLTAEELQKLYNTPCKTPQLKAAFFFAAFTGLRFSDINRLRWEDIKSDGGAKYIRIEMKKTKREIIVPLSATAQSFLPPEESKGKVFDKLVQSGTTRNVAIKRWAKLAGIEKDICFHVSRHTFATSLLTQGADLYTTSKLLGHTNLKTTQIYAEIVNKKKEEAVNLLDNIKLDKGH